jgi:hypothetical protein
MKEDTRYYVILKNPEKFDLQNLSEILSTCIPVLRVDLVIRLKQSWGLLHKTSDIKEAQKIQEKFDQNDIDTFLSNESELNSIHEVRIIKKAAPEFEGLLIEEENQKRVYPWSNFILLCAGQILKKSTVKKRVLGDGKVRKHLLLTGLTPLTAVAISHNRLKGKTVVEDKIGTNYTLDLISREKGESIRIHGDSFNYTYLGEKKAYNVLINFKNLYLDTAKHLPKVYKNQGARAMEAQQMMQIRYSTERAYENEILWLMQLIGADPAGGLG